MIYEYRCISCNHVSEYIRKMADRDKVADCKKCGSGTMRMVTAPHINWRVMGMDADFPTAAAKWDRMRETGAKAEPPQNLTHI